MLGSSSTVSTTGTTKTPSEGQFASLGLTRDFNFKDVPLSELVATKHDMVRALTTTSIEEAIDLMRQHHISSIPIYDKRNKLYLGIVDFFDIMVFTVFGAFQKQLLEADFRNYRFGDQDCASLLPLSREGNFLRRFEATDSVEDVLESLSKGFHRIMINKPIKGGGQKHRHRILSQFDVVKFLYHWAVSRNIPMLKRRVDELHLTNTRPKVLSEQTTALEAYQIMYRESINAVGIINKEGVLVGNLSTTDLRNITPQTMPSLFLPCLLFLSTVNQQSPAKPVVCRPDSTLEFVMLAVITAKIKRIWVVDAASKPISVITMSDIISKFSPYDKTLPLR